MPPLTGLIGRVAYSVLAGVVAFIVILIIGILVAKYEAEIGDLLKKFSPLIGLLVGAVYFFARPTPNV